jgi:hypothetical protein
MKLSIKFLSTTMLTTGIALFFNACTESKSAAPAATPKPSDGDTEGGETEGSEGDDEPSDADMCDDGVKEAGLDSEFDDLIDAFCDEYRSDVESATYDKSDYDAGASAGVNKILVKDEKEEANDQLSYLIFAANDLEASAADYFAMNKLRNNKPDVYKDEGFEVNPKTKMCNVTPGDSQTQFEVSTADDDSVVHYVGKSKYKKVSNNVYVISTTLEESLETLKEMRSFTIIVGNGAGKSKVYSAAFQQVEKLDQDTETVISRAKKNLAAEMRRNFANAREADKVADLEDAESNPGDDCAQ